jgi:hypothetical protein
MAPVLISIDYDKTWAADPVLWELFAKSAHSRGHRVILVTNRMDTPGNRKIVGENVSAFVDQIIFAGFWPKRQAAAHFGLRPDIWVDDRPDTVDAGLREFTPQMRH